MTKKLIITLYTLIIVCIGLATIIEKYRGTAFVGNHIYGAWWFSALWAVLTIATCAYIVRQQLYKRMAVFLLHLSFVVILAGAFTTHLFALRGTIRLRSNVSEASFTDHSNHVRQLPSPLMLKEFRIINYPGTDAPLDYQSVIQCDNQEVLVSMNNIGKVDDYRLFQQSYDSDGEGVTLGISYDPYGIAISYVGYLLLLAGIIATLLSRRTQMRVLYRLAMTAVLLLLSLNVNANLHTVDKNIAQRMGTINVLYNNRICPLNTVTTDFVTKLTGCASWKGYTADEIFVSWMIYYSPWEHQKLIRVKSHDVQQLLGINGQWASYADFIDEYHEYKLKEAVAQARAKGGEAKALLEADEKFHLVEMFYRGQFIRMFPYNFGDKVDWYTPGGQSLPKVIPVKEQFFIKQSMDFLTESIVTGQHDRALEIIAKIKLFQRDMIGDLLPSDGKTKAELFYNKLRSFKFPVLITAQLGLRWWLSGHIPVSNGHETMLFMAWVLLLLTIVLFRKVRIIIVIGPLAALCCLLVAMFAGSGSQLTPLMPVLQSPLLSVHVMTVMSAYALFALQMLLGVYAFIVSDTRRITALSRLLLYPAVFLLAIGIFLGAIWANVSWGNYWSWDPKESWALITLMVYAIPLHQSTIGILRRPICYHIYMVGAFMTVLITYFGVNYLLGGMHSYA
ncbi:MAG: cytochrome c biogenesis protein CcsA [Prevotella sp.]|nr:cytochrome c biogenesis protein CcsA [Prevotella sp.]